MADYKVPPLDEEQRIPRLAEDSMRHSRPYAAKAEHQEALGFPGELVEGWHDKAIEKFGEILERSRPLQVYMDACVKCGACTDKCHYFLGTGDPKNMPVARQDLMRKVYRRHFTLAGKWLPWLVGAEDLTEELLDEWYSYFHQCSQCRRCSVYCPYGIDTAEFSMAAREIMDHIGKGQKYCNEIIGKVHDDRQQSRPAGEPALASTLWKGLEEDVEEETGVSRCASRVNEVGADVLLVTPSGRFFRRAACRRAHRIRQGVPPGGHQLDGQLAMPRKPPTSPSSSAAYEQMHKIAERIRQAALDLGVKRIVFGECGHAWRVAYSFLGHFGRALGFPRSELPGAPQHICEFTHDLIERGALTWTSPPTTT